MTISEMEKLIAPVIEPEGAELVHLTFAKEGPRWVLRAFLDKESGITLDECAYFSDRIGSLLDSSNAIGRPYVLEVSSPGLDRLIKKEKDFRRFAGKAVKFRLRVPEQGQRNFHGTLRGFEDGKVAVELAGAVRFWDLGAIEEMRLDYAAEADL